MEEGNAQAKLPQDPTTIVISRLDHDSTKYLEDLVGSPGRCELVERHELRPEIVRRRPS